MLAPIRRCYGAWRGFNVSDTDPVVAVVARSDASEWENIVNYDREKERPTPGS